MNAQAVCRKIGESGCYFLSLLHIAKAEYGALSLYQLAVSKGLMDEDCYVKDPAELLALACGGKWSVRHEVADYVTARNEIEILRYERKTVGTTYAHFVVGDGFGRVAYDPLGDSITVAKGKLVSKRIIRRLS